MTDESALPRETGSEKTDVSCPNCGGQLPLTESPYGGISPGTCPKCYPAAAPTEKAAAQPAKRELGSKVDANEGSQGGAA